MPVGVFKNLLGKKEKFPIKPLPLPVVVYSVPADKDNMNGKYANNDDSSDHESSISGDENRDRGNWTGKLDFLLSCLSYAVGLGNLWRFPYLCYRNGGGAFLIPYVLMLVFTGMPLFLMELSFGQYASEGPVSVYKACPLFSGIGWGMFAISFFVGVYYNMIIAWALHYLVASFTALPGVPWGTCDNHWNSPACRFWDSFDLKNCTANNGTWYNHTCFTANNTVNYEEIVNLANQSLSVNLETRKSASDEYFHNYVLDISGGLHEPGGLKWQLALSLLGAWCIVGLCQLKGIKTSGKAVYFTATFPYVVLIALLVRGATLPGCLDGIKFYITPDWARLKTAKVWGDAAVQIFFSLSPCWGGLITLASYNKFHNNVLRDAIVVSIGNCLTSFFAGFVIFGIVGYMAHELGVEVKDVASQGAGLAFIVYPEVVTRLPISPFWAIIFFAMLLTLGLGTQFAVITTTVTTILDKWTTKLRQGHRPKLVLLGVCSVSYCVGLVFCSESGMYVLQLMDNFAATYSVLIIGLAECLVISYVYGVDKFCDNISKMIKRPISIYWKILWRFVTPGLLIFIMIFTWIDFKPSKYGDYEFPLWADLIGWCLSFTSVSVIPIVAIYKIVTFENKEESIISRIRILTRPTSEWGPALQQHRENDMPFNTLHESQVPLKLDSISNLASSSNGISSMPSLPKISEESKC